MDLCVAAGSVGLFLRNGVLVHAEENVVAQGAVEQCWFLGYEGDVLAVVLQLLVCNVQTIVSYLSCF